MTNTDTSAEAVEIFAEWADRGGDKELAEFIRALLAERDQLQAQVEKSEAGLTQIAEMKPHHAGQTPNEYHMQEIARDALAAYRKARGEG